MHNRAFDVAGVVAVLVAAGPAVGQGEGPLVAELVEYTEVRAAIPASTAATFGRVFRPTADQRAAAEALITAGRMELARVVNRHLRAVRDDPTLAQIKESERAVVQDAAGVERRLWADLRFVLEPAQDARFAEFERAQRRSLLRLIKTTPMPVDVWRFLEVNGFDVPAEGPLAALLERFDRESDAALVRQRRALKAYYESVRAGFDGSAESRERDRKAQNELFAANANLERVLAAVVEPMLGLLPAELGDRLVVEAVKLSSEGFDRTVGWPERYPVAREVLALELSAEQRERAGRVIEGAKGEATALARACVVGQARYVLLEAERKAEVKTTPLNAYWGEASKLRVRVSGELLGLLTREQRAAYDASEVVEPSEASAVGGE